MEMYVESEKNNVTRKVNFSLPCISTQLLLSVTTISPYERLSVALLLLYYCLYSCLYLHSKLNNISSSFVLLFS